MRVRDLSLDKSPQPQKVPVMPSEVLVLSASLASLAVVAKSCTLLYRFFMDCLFIWSTVVNHEIITCIADNSLKRNATINLSSTKTVCLLDVVGTR